MTLASRAAPNLQSRHDRLRWLAARFAVTE
jgi:hypothetical protein